MTKKQLIVEEYMYICSLAYCETSGRRRKAEGGGGGGAGRVGGTTGTQSALRYRHNLGNKVDSNNTARL